MTEQDMEQFRFAALGRVFIEIAKMGAGASEALPDLLKLADSHDNPVRQGMLLALVELAPTPCNACATRLTNVLDSQRAQPTLANLSTSTGIALNYFINQGATVSLPRR